MIHTVGYDVIYPVGSFVSDDLDRVPLEPYDMWETTEALQLRIFRLGGGRWSLIDRDEELGRDERTSVAELTIVVTPGPDERKLLFDIIRLIEEHMLNDGYAVVPDLRVVEPAGMRCCACNEPSRWLRRTRFNSDRCFCDDHARGEADFGRENPGYLVWKELQPVES